MSETKDRLVGTLFRSRRAGSNKAGVYLEGIAARKAPHNDGPQVWLSIMLPQGGGGVQFDMDATDLVNLGRACLDAGIALKEL